MLDATGVIHLYSYLPLVDEVLDLLALVGAEPNREDTTAMAKPNP